MKITIDKSWQNIASFLLAMTPFFRNYRLPFFNINFATFWFLTITLIALFNRVQKKGLSLSWRSKSAALPVIICMTSYMLLEYYLIDIRKIGSCETAGNYFGLMLYVVEIWGLFFVFHDCRIREAFKIHTVRIAIVMSFVIYIQYILYYCFGMELSKRFLFPFSGLYESSVADHIGQMRTVFDGLFRPSAFFLEPSHFAAYSVIALGIVLFEVKSKKICFFLTSAVVLSTSGLGIAATLLLWGIKAYLSMKSLNSRKMANVLGFSLLAMLVIIVLYYTVDIVRQAINRVLISGEQNAFSGRLWTSSFIDRLSGANVYWGAGFRNRPISVYTGLAYYMTGIVELTYCQGWFGTILFAIMMGIAIYKMWRYRNILNFSVMVLFVVWVVFGNIVTPYYLVKYMAFTFYEEPSHFSKEWTKDRLGNIKRSKRRKKSVENRAAHFLGEKLWLRPTVLCIEG